MYLQLNNIDLVIFLFINNQEIVCKNQNQLKKLLLWLDHIGSITILIPYRHINSTELFYV